MKESYSIFADYHQFYLWDKGIRPDAPEDYTEADVSRRIKTAPHVVVIMPARNMDVPVELELLDSAPDAEFESWDHVAEASLELPSGQLEIHECTGGSIDTFSVQPGSYRVRACFGALNEIGEDGPEGGDHYLIVVWPAKFGPVSVLKQFGVADVG